MRHRSASALISTLVDLVALRDPSSDAPARQARQTRQDGPHAEYTARLAARRRAHERHQRADRLLASVRLVVVALFIAIAVLSLWRAALSVWWLLVPTLLFGAVVAIHSRVAHVKGRLSQSMDFYAKGLARLEDRWAGEGVTGDEFADEGHPYTGALDIFGCGSLFELLCTARTHAGQTTLARWLSQPASCDEVRARQEAVAELRERLDLREALLAHGVERASSVERAQLAAWATAPATLRPRATRMLAAVVTIVVLGSMVASWAFGFDEFGVSGSGLVQSGFNQTVFYGSLLCAAIVGLVYSRRVRDVLTRAERHRPQLLSLQPALQLLQHEAWTSRSLTRLRSRLDASGLMAVERIDQFDRLVGWCEIKKLDLPVALLGLWMWNVLCAPFSFLFWHTQMACALEAWRARHGAAIAEWIAVTGELEALCAIAAYAYEHPDQPFPEMLEHAILRQPAPQQPNPQPSNAAAQGAQGLQDALFEGEDLRHPLIARTRCVSNSIRLDAATRFLIVSGSNMSGKSTFLRTVGIHVVLASIGAPVPAARLRLSPLRIGATLQVHDSLRAGVSRFYAEIQRVRHIVDMSDEGPVLFLFDELFHGTNSHERTLAAEAVLTALVDRGAIGLVTTHDLALTAIAPIATIAESGRSHEGRTSHDEQASHTPTIISRGQPSRGRNVHFRDHFEDGQLLFDHKMHPGVASTTNALALIASMGLPTGRSARYDEALTDVVLTRAADTPLKIHSATSRLGTQQSQATNG